MTRHAVSIAALLTALIVPQHSVTAPKRAASRTSGRSAAIKATRSDQRRRGSRSTCEHRNSGGNGSRSTTRRVPALEVTATA
jgi:hypothetical protein